MIGDLIKLLGANNARTIGLIVFGITLGAATLTSIAGMSEDVKASTLHEADQRYASKSEVIQRLARIESTLDQILMRLEILSKKR